MEQSYERQNHVYWPVDWHPFNLMKITHHSIHQGHQIKVLFEWVNARLIFVCGGSFGFFRRACSQNSEGES